ncbi:21652_t:CDS:2, partial [Gigaspora rosea]
MNSKHKHELDEQNNSGVCNEGKSVSNNESRHLILHKALPKWDEYQTFIQYQKSSNGMYLVKHFYEIELQDNLELCCQTWIRASGCNLK